MSTINVNTLRTATGASPVLVAEIAKATDVSAVRADLAAPTGSGLVGANDYQTQAEVNAEWESVKKHGAKGDGTTDDRDAIQAAIDTERVVYLPAGVYRISASLNPAPISGRFDLRGEATRKTTIQALDSFPAGYLLHSTGSYDLRELTIVGIANVLGLYGLGTETAGSSGAAPVLDGVSFAYFDECVRFSPEYEHPLALNYDRVYCQYFMRAGINLGGMTGAASSGESNFDFGRITITNAGQTRTEYAATVTENTPTTSADRLVWTGTVPTYGFLVMRSANGTTGWHVPPNWTNIASFTALTFDAAKTVSETWFYKVVPQTVGLLVRRAKAISGGSIQTEYVGIGQIYNDIRGANINSVYYEVRDQITPCPSLCAVATINAECFAVLSGWVEGSSYGLLVQSNSNGEFNNVRHSDIWWAAIGMASTATTSRINYSGIICNVQILKSIAASAFDYNYDASEFTTASFDKKLSHTTKVKQSLEYRGLEKSSWMYDATSGAQLTGLNIVDIKPFSKTVMQAPFQNTADHTILTNNIATSFFSFTVPSNSASSLTLGFVIRVIDGASVVRQVAGGMLVVSAVSAAGSVVAGVASTVATALSSGTLTGPTFTASVAGSVVTVLANVNSSVASSIRLQLTPVIGTASLQPTALTQL